MSLQTRLELPGSVALSWDIQRTLSQAQAIPVLGMAISPVKAVLSVAQVITGIAGSIVFGTGTVLSFTVATIFLKPEVGSFGERCAVNTFKSMAHIAMGLAGFTYSVVNFGTLTVAGVWCEALARPPRI